MGGIRVIKKMWRKNKQKIQQNGMKKKKEKKRAKMKRRKIEKKTIIALLQHINGIKN
jgi:hypothetical protein